MSQEREFKYANMGPEIKLRGPKSLDVLTMQILQSGLLVYEALSAPLLTSVIHRDYTDRRIYVVRHGSYGRYN